MDNTIDAGMLNNSKSILENEKDISSLFKTVKGEMTAESLLKVLTKGDLDSIRKTLNVIGTSSLKKNELAEHLDKHLKSNLEEIIKNYITLDEFQYISIVAQNNGIYEYTHNENNYDIVKSLRFLGLIFPVSDKKVNKIVIPTDYLEQINVLLNSKEIENIVINNNKVLKMVKGLLYYYGVATFDILWEKIKCNLDKEIDKEHAFNFIASYTNRNGSIRLHKDSVYMSELIDVEHIISEQTKHNDLDYKDFDVNAILFACDNTKSVWNVHEKNLYDYFKHVIVDEYHELESLVNSCVYGIKNDYKLPELLNYITSAVIFENQMQIFQLAKYMNEINNNCNLWILKGHTLNEVYKNGDKSNAVIVANRVGRNDACPCGSGKKYKKCCGKN